MKHAITLLQDKLNEVRDTLESAQRQNSNYIDIQKHMNVPDHEIEKFAMVNESVIKSYEEICASLNEAIHILQGNEPKIVVTPRQDIANRLTEVFGSNAVLYSVSAVANAGSRPESFIVMFDRSKCENDFVVTTYGVHSDSFFWSSYDLSYDQAKKLFQSKVF